MMKKQIERGVWIIAETTVGGEVIPFDLVGCTYLEDIANYTEGKPLSAIVRSGYGGRLSMPGYLDCTPWLFGDTLEEVSTTLDRLYFEN